MGQVLQNVMTLLQIATVITKCDVYYKLRQYSDQGWRAHMLASQTASSHKPIQTCLSVATSNALWRLMNSGFKASEDHLVQNKQSLAGFNFYPGLDGAFDDLFSCKVDYTVR